jgi:hypothetical protein
MLRYRLTYFILVLSALVNVHPLSNQSTIDETSIHLRMETSTCSSSFDCPKHSWCNISSCQCEKGWITWCHWQQCSYRQLSKFSCLFISIVFGLVGMDWFILSRLDRLHILVGILKCLLLIASLVWRQLATVNQTKSANSTFACRLGSILSLISISWWLIDCVRILVDAFPDGYGAPLVSY